jgi:hypothetical protein
MICRRARFALSMTRLSSSILMKEGLCLYVITDEYVTCRI